MMSVFPWLTVTNRSYLPELLLFSQSLGKVAFEFRHLASSFRHVHLVTRHT